MPLTSDMFSLAGRVAVVTGGYGVIGGTIADGLAAAGARVAVLGRNRDKANAKAAALRAHGVETCALVADVLEERALHEARAVVLDRWRRVDILINAAGGNVARSRSDAGSVFEVPLDAHEEVLRLNLHGTLIPCMAFGETLAAQRTGCIVNISSMAAFQAISGVFGYSIAKAGVENATRWLAVDLARRHGDGIRVNAIAPGFFVSEQNRAVLIEPDGSYTDRARRIIERTPMGRFGRPEELSGVVRWLCCDAASFVTGVVIPVDGGFSAFSGI